MNGLEIFAGILIAAQLIFTVQIVNNVRYALQKYKRPRDLYGRKCALIVPCKGLEETFEENILSFFRQDYDDYALFFVVECEQDPAYSVLKDLQERQAGQTRAGRVHLLVSGKSRRSSQKLHNMLYAFEHIDPETEFLIFADSDACAGPQWLSHIVYPLRESQKERIGASTGYRWFIPKTNNFATMTLSAVNAKIAQLLGNTRFNMAWGGSMAIRVDTFRRLKLDEIWAKALSDDLSLSAAVTKAGLKIMFVPACMVASYETMTWKQFWEFGRRQFVITRIYRPKMWCFGIFSAVFAVGGLWGGIAAAVWTLTRPQPSAWLIAWPIVFGVCQWLHAFLRQWMIGILLEKDRAAMRLAVWADYCGFWLFSAILLAVLIASAIGNNLRWRGIRYRLKSPTDIEIIE